ncbi:hypothetical protein WGM54_18710 [Paenibacillus polymyxa]
MFEPNIQLAASLIMDSAGKIQQSLGFSQPEDSSDHLLHGET